MKILFIGPYRQPDEWGRKSRSVLQALKNTENVSVTSRPIVLNGSSSVIYDAYTENAEFAIESEYDILIQFLLPSMAVYDGSFSKRIGIFNTETVPYHIPQGQLTGEFLMDEIWTDSIRIRDSVQTIFDKYVINTKVIAVPPTLDVQLTPSETQSIRTTNTELKDQFLFYYIGNIVDNKSGFQETCLAYLNTFTVNDPVTLVIGLETQIPTEQINASINQSREIVQSYIPISNQGTIHVISPQNQVLDPVERAAIHSGCDCLVSVGYSFSTNTTVLEGAVYNRTPIVNKHNACYEWLGDQHVWGIESYEDMCVFPMPPSIYRFTIGELWNKPILKSLAETMKHVYINKFARDKKQAANMNLRSKFEQMTCDHFVSGEK